MNVYGLNTHWVVPGIALKGTASFLYVLSSFLSAYYLEYFLWVYMKEEECTHLLYNMRGHVYFLDTLDTYIYPRII